MISSAQKRHCVLCCAVLSILMMLHRGLDDCWSWPYKNDWNLLGWIFFRWYRHIKRQVDFEFEYQWCRRESSSERVDIVTDVLHSFRLSITNELQFFHMLWGLSHIFGHRFISSLLFDPRQLHQVISVSIAQHFSSCFFKIKQNLFKFGEINLCIIFSCIIEHGNVLISNHVKSFVVFCRWKKKKT